MSTRTGKAVALNWTGTWSEPVRRHFFIGRDLTEKQAAEAQLRHVAEDGCDRPADRRRRARLQQYPDRDHRNHRHSGRSRRRRPAARRRRQADRRSRRTRRQPDQASARLCPQAAAAAARGRRQCAGAGGGEAAASDARRTHRNHAAAGRGCMDGAGRSEPAHHGRAQSGTQRARRHAQWRQARARDQQRLSRRELCRACTARSRRATMS